MYGLIFLVLCALTMARAVYLAIEGNITYTDAALFTAMTFIVLVRGLVNMHRRRRGYP